MEAKVTIGIPGRWQSWPDLMQEVAEKSDGYVLAGHTLYDTKRELGFGLDVYEHDPHLMEAFTYASRTTLPQGLLEELRQHACTVYVTAEVGSFEGLQRLVEAGAALLRAGGMAVLVETAALAHTKDAWEELLQEDELLPFYAAFVALSGDEDGYSSCGMKAFGLPDARVPATLAPEEAVVVLNGFNMYRIADQPIIEDGQTVSFDDDSSYSTHWTEDDRYETDHAFYNPFGMLWVEPVQHGIWGRMKGMLKN